jgi:hypothetical protein
MKLVRPVVAVATLACLAGGVTANAATKPVCNLVVDDKGDGAGVLADSDGLDILSADIASDSKKITAVIRLAGPPTKTLTTAAPEGGAYYFVFNAPGATNAVYLTWSNGLAGSEFAMGDVDA